MEALPVRGRRDGERHAVAYGDTAVELPADLALEATQQVGEVRRVGEAPHVRPPVALLDAGHERARVVGRQVLDGLGAVAHDVHPVQVVGHRQGHVVAEPVAVR